MDLDQERPRIPRAQDDLFRPGVSARAKYQAMVVGRPGLGALLRHELVVLVAQARAGAAGLVLPPTPGSDKAAILAVLDRLEAGGSTAGGAGA